MEEKQTLVQMQASNGTAMQTTFNFFDPEQFAVMQRYCKMYASSDLVPDSYRITDKESEGKAIGNCMIAMDIALRIGASPLMIMQNMVPIYGRPSWSSKFLIATINACGRFKPLKYRMTVKGKLGIVTYTEYDKTWETNPQTGRRYAKNIAKQVQFDGTQIDNIECVAYTTEKYGDEIMESTPVDLMMAVKEGWYTKSGSKWQTMPVKMLKYRAASFWANEYAPELSMGIYTVEENEDIHTVDVPYEELPPRQPKTPVKVDIPTTSEQPQEPADSSATKADEDDCGY